MNYDIGRFADYCRKSLNLNEECAYEYKSLAVCIVDCVYSLRTKYSTTKGVVKKFCDYYLDGDSKAESMTISEFLIELEKLSNLSEFADILGNHQKLGNPAIPKENVCYQLAKYMKCLSIDSVNDFRRFPEQGLLEVVIHSVKGMGDAGTNYLFMLAGDPDRCKPDVHIRHCLCDVFGEEVDNKSCQEIFTKEVEVLKPEYPMLSVRALDGAIWRKYSRWED